MCIYKLRDQTTGNIAFSSIDMWQDSSVNITKHTRVIYLCSFNIWLFYKKLTKKFIWFVSNEFIYFVEILIKFTNSENSGGWDSYLLHYVCTKCVRFVSKCFIVLLYTKLCEYLIFLSIILFCVSFFFFSITFC